MTGALTSWRDGSPMSPVATGCVVSELQFLRASFRGLAAEQPSSKAQSLLGDRAIRPLSAGNGICSGVRFVPITASRRTADSTAASRVAAANPTRIAVVRNAAPQRQTCALFAPNHHSPRGNPASSVTVTQTASGQGSVKVLSAVTVAVSAFAGNRRRRTPQSLRDRVSPQPRKSRMCRMLMLPSPLRRRSHS